MSWSTLPPALRELADRMATTGVTVDGRVLRLTAKELDALKLWDANFGYGRLGQALGIAKETARDRVQRGLRKLTRAAQAEGLM